MVTGGQDPLGLGRVFAVPPGGVRIVQAPPGGPRGVVILDRVDEVSRDETAYCIHGQTTCMSCQAWCWLGDKTHALVTSGDTAPMCRPCAKDHMDNAPQMRPVVNAHDHRRADGPH